MRRQDAHVTSVWWNQMWNRLEFVFFKDRFISYVTVRPMRENVTYVTFLIAQISELETPNTDVDPSSLCEILPDTQAALSFSTIISGFSWLSPVVVSRRFWPHLRMAWRIDTDLGRPSPWRKSSILRSSGQQHVPVGYRYWNGSPVCDNHLPADKRRNNSVIITSKRRHDVVLT